MKDRNKPSLWKRIKGFKFEFKWVHCNGETTKRSATICSYHPRESITWIWALYWNKPIGLSFNLFWRRSYNSFNIILPIIGCFSFLWQKPMWRERTICHCGGPPEKGGHPLGSFMCYRRIVPKNQEPKLVSGSGLEAIYEVQGTRITRYTLIHQRGYFYHPETKVWSSRIPDDPED